jgi:uncharacterized protein YjiS (DUF1127 family)
MFSLLIECSALKTYALRAAAEPPRWVRFGRLIANEYRIRRATREMRALDERMLHDVGLDRGRVEYAARFGRV